MMGTEFSTAEILFWRRIGRHVLSVPMQRLLSDSLSPRQRRPRLRRRPCPRGRRPSCRLLQKRARPRQSGEEAEAAAAAALWQFRRRCRIPRRPPPPRRGGESSGPVTAARGTLTYTYVSESKRQTRNIGPDDGDDISNWLEY